MGMQKLQGKIHTTLFVEEMTLQHYTELFDIQVTVHRYKFV